MSSGYARWLSSTIAAHPRQSSKVSTSSGRIPCLAAFSRIWTPDGGAPASASSETTITSRSRNDSYSEKRSVITRAAMPTPVALYGLIIDGQATLRYEVAIAERHECGRRDVDGGREVLRRRPELVGQAIDDQPVAHDGCGGPDEEQHEERDRGKGGKPSLTAVDAR